ncbi:MAG: TIGR03960 family B12-binding radical SAM protein [Bacillota bacterium]
MNYEEILLQVEKPARYVGGEYNVPDVTKPHKVSFCIAFPDIYEVAMSNLGIQIIYDAINKDPDAICERCFAPWMDMGDLLKKHNMPLRSIETQKPLKDFDVVGISVQYELSYTNILYLLDLAQIPYYAKDRGEEYPIMLAGGPCVANPEPFAEYFDVICIGDGETFDLEVAKIVQKYKGNKTKILAEVSKIQGAYVPSLSVIENGIVVSSVSKAVVSNLNTTTYPQHPLVPNLEIVHDRPVVELFRGCHAGCRFCQACFFYRPIRVREEDTVVNICEQLLSATGADEIGFSSLSSGDYTYIHGAIKRVLDLTESKNVKLQLPSLRLDSFSRELTKGSKKNSLTFAPEAGTQRLRNVINKNITEEDVERTMRMAFEDGYKSVKLYFMVGLPTETDEDILAIPELARKIQRIYMSICHNKSLNINISTSVFVPKSITPFQWVAQLSIDEMKRRQRLIREEVRKMKGVSYHWHEETTSFMEGVYARGDRSIARLTEIAYNMGCRFDGWSEFFNYSRWQEAIEKSGIDVTKFTNGCSVDERLPWDFIDFGVKKEYLLKEYNKALEESTSEGCKYDCKGCGANKYAKCQIQQK